jgi:hypothetical protein
MALTESDAIPALGMALAGTQFYSAALPSIFTIRRFPDQYAAKDIRDGEKFASVATLTLGAFVSTILDSKTPLIMAAVVAGIMVGMYEYALSSSRTEGFLMAEENEES